MNTSIALTRYRVTLEALEPLDLPAYLGSILRGDFTPFWPYLVFGQWTHVGKGATFGLGQYRLSPESPDGGRNP